MGLPGDPESGQNILMEPKTIHTYVHTYSTTMSGAVHMYVQYAFLSLMVIFSAGQAHEVLRTGIENMATFQRGILAACNAQTPF